MLKPVLSASPRPDIDTPRTRERKDVCQRRLAFFESQSQTQARSQPSPPSTKQSRSSQGRSHSVAVRKAPSESLTDLTKHNNNASKVRTTTRLSQSDDVRQSMLLDARVLAANQRSRSSGIKVAQHPRPSSNHINDSRVRHSESDSHFTKRMSDNHPIPNNTRHQQISQSCHLDGRLENDLFTHSNTTKVQAGGAFERLGNPSRESETQSQSAFPVVVEQREIDEINSQRFNQQPSHSFNGYSNYNKDTNIRRSERFDLLGEFSTPLEREAVHRSKQSSQSTVNVFESNKPEEASSDDMPLDIPSPRKVSQSSSADTKSSSNDENFDPDNLTSVLGKERYDRLMKNFEESEWISNVDSARDAKVNIFLDDGETEVTVSNRLSNDQTRRPSDGDLGLQTHRPSDSGREDIAAHTNMDHQWHSNQVASPVHATADNIVKCAFSIDEIYAEANKVGTQGFAFKHSESDSDSDNAINPAQNRAVRNSTSTYVFSANDITASDPVSAAMVTREEEPTVSKAFRTDNAKLGDSFHKSLEGREVVLPRQAPFGPVPQLKKQDGEPVHSQDRRLVYNNFETVKTEQGVRRSDDSDKHIEGVRQHVEKRQVTMGQSQGQGQAALLPEDFVGSLPPGTFTNPSLERYFSSIERVSADKASTLSSDTFEPIPEPDIEVTPREKSLEVTGQPLSVTDNVDRSGTKNSQGKKADKHQGHSRRKVVNLRDSGNHGNRALQQLQDQDSTPVKDDDLFTKVTSIVGEMEPGGLTERLKNLGIGFDFLKHDASKDNTGNKVPEGQEDAKECQKPSSSSSVAKICPDCSKPNKKYVTWCIECGCVLIGVEVTPLKGDNNKAEEDQREEPHKAEDNKTRGPLRPQQCEEPVFRTLDLHSSDAGRQFQSRLEQAWKTEEKKAMVSQESGPNQSSDYVSDNERLVYNDVTNPRKSLPNHMRAELSLNLRSSADSSLPSTSSAAQRQPNKPRRTVEASCPDLGDDMEFEYNEEVSRKSLPNALKVELSLDLRSSVNSTPEPPKENTSTNKPRKPLPSRSRQSQNMKQGQSQMSTVDEKSEAPEVAFGGQVVHLEHGRNVNKEVVVDEDGIFVDDDVEDDDVDIVDEFVDLLRKDPRFKPTKQDVTRPKSAGVPQPSKSLQPAKSKMRPQSAGKRSFPGVQSKVRASIEAEPPQRRWQKSSIAWSSYNASELSKPSSLQIVGQGSGGDLRSSHDQGGGDRDVRRSHPVRPASAGGRPRSATRGQSGDGERGGGDGRSSRNRDGPVRNSTGKGLHSKTSAMNTYAKYLSMAQGYTGRLYKTDTPQNARDKVPDGQFAMSPRIQDGEVSRWLCLPDEILLYIFSFLSHWDLTKAAQICKNFCRIALDDSLWRRISLKKKALTDDWLIQIGKHQPSSLSLVQCHGNRVTANGLRELFRQCADSLTELNCTGVSKGRLTGDDLLLHAASRCRYLNRVDVSWCNVNDNGVTAVAETSDRLEVLCLNGCQSVTDDAIESVVAKHGQCLRELEMFGCFNVTARGVTSIATYCRNLRTLNLGQCWKLTDASISYLSSNMKEVEHLDLRGCKQLTDACVTQIVRNCSRLRTLSLANCPNITDLAIGEIATYCPHIRSLDVCGCKKITNSGVKFLATCCRHLEYLDLSSTAIDSKSVSSLASYCNRKLEVMKLNFCKHINLSCLTRLAKNCKRLKKLYIYGVNGIRNVDAIRRENHQLWVEM